MATSDAKICKVVGCPDKSTALNYCQKHYKRFKQHGDPNIQGRYKFEGSDIDKLHAYSRVDTDGCWLWAGSKSKGYGYVWDRSIGKMRLAHRWSYELNMGTIPEGYEIDHMCHTKDTSCSGGDSCKHRACVNPSHLEPVTGVENNHRSLRNNRRLNKTHCPQGHSYSGENLYIGEKGYRYCLTCINKSTKERRMKAKKERIAEYVNLYST
jgi:hypothetical protein